MRGDHTCIEAALLLEGCVGMHTGAGGMCWGEHWNWGARGGGGGFMSCDPTCVGDVRCVRGLLGCIQELGGRPRVDVLCNMSGIFRDSFQNVVELLDDLFKRAGQASEPADRNFIRCSHTVTHLAMHNLKHVLL